LDETVRGMKSISRAFIALIILHTAFSFPTKPNHGFGFHRRGPVAVVVIASTQKELFSCKFAQKHPCCVEFLKSLSSPTLLSCYVVSGVALRTLGKVTDRWGESTAAVKEKWGETNVPFIFLCWSIGIYLLRKMCKVTDTDRVFSPSGYQDAYSFVSGHGVGCRYCDAGDNSQTSVVIPGLIRCHRQPTRPLEEAV
jgi:hypothetical protein